ncbi:MAG: Arylsulfatase [Acidobacteria bacterium]|nr:Arylsulfatase [Acidobacteriota bacterium]
MILNGRSLHCGRARALPLIALTVVLIPVLLAACNRRETSGVLPRARSAAHAPVIIISIDTLRADHLPAYGYRNVATPHLDALRRDSVLFENAYAHVPLTLPSHVALLTGSLPAENGVRDNIGYRVDPRRTSLPSILKKAGYDTGAAISAYVLRASTGVGPMFDFYDDGIAFESGVSLGALQRKGDETAAAAQRWVAQRGARPFFLMLHLYEPHTPYEPPEPFASQYPSSPYDGEIAQADAIVGRFLDFLRANGLYDRSIIVLLSDHGEGLGEHGEDEHGILLHREALHVPLLIKLPKQELANGSVSAPVGLIDVAPTIASLAGIQPPREFHGIPLLSGLREEVVASRSVYSETLYPMLHLGWSAARSLVGDRYHYIETTDPELYDLHSDPAERTNVRAGERRVSSAMRERLQAIPLGGVTPAAIDKEEAAKLAALGYLGNASAGPAGTTPPAEERTRIIGLFQEGTAALKRRDYAAAIAGLSQLIERNPRFTDAALRLGQAYEKTGRFQDAVTAYKKVLVSNPAMRDEVALALGATYLNLEQYDLAKANAELVLSSNPAAAQLLLGRIALQRGDFAEAERQARAAMKDSHYRLNASVLFARVATKTKRYDEALRVLDSAKSELAAGHLEPVRELEFARAEALIHRERLPEAEAAFRAEMAAFPEDLDSYTHLAAILFLQKRGGDGARVLEEMVRTNPTPEANRVATELAQQFGMAGR